MIKHEKQNKLYPDNFNTTINNTTQKILNYIKIA